MNRAQAFIDILLALALTILAGVVAGIVAQATMGSIPFMLILALQGVIILVGIDILLRLRGEGWADLRLRTPSSQHLLEGLQALAIAFAVNFVLNLLAHILAPSLIEGHQERLTGVADILGDGLPLAGILLVMLFIGFYEEVLARGFLLRRCEILLGGVWGPVIISSILFGLGHMYQGLWG
ncbi:hypothetical protein CAI21_10400 [Alkalilimnicola ehrlichii]|uniref:CAAX prenyl protease 2/Lysostaphin resistance protein A-like domain-containing protein n=1 Tax=Alkalilimnicola ehrlichii TaxID=351052 RepID=A0A3E0WSY8_9GAMM|nr:CPBP family intramembrane glutamic endopeptidase [Alkalilimnicola ehrlichii]RFA29171.1 hypothetical protein CAI21_10400 [Alkalilimnicola ehrlichii]RFA36084.1 hypothetical protein CAL65_11550 [Alkalilimnicola ehrlichii]